MSSRWPGWRTHPGIEVAEMVKRARQQDETYRQRGYVWGPDEAYVTAIGWQVDRDGTVSIPWDPNWEPIVTNGLLTGFRSVKAGTIENLIEISVLVVPEGNPPWTPALTARFPPELIGMFCTSDSMTDGIDIAADRNESTITIGFTNGDGGITMVQWNITHESAASVVALIRDRHGEPASEVTMGPEDAVKFHEQSQRALDTSGAIITSANGCGECDGHSK